MGVPWTMPLKNNFKEHQITTAWLAWLSGTH